MNKAGPTRIVALVEGAVGASLGAVLGSIKLYALPQGGSVSLAGVVPIWVVSIRRGPWMGFLAGCGLGFLKFLLNPQMIHPLQPFLDYPLAYGVLGMAAGLVPRNPFLGAVVGALLKLVVHVVSGVLFFAAYAVGSGHTLVMYSLAYNGTHWAPDLAVALIVLGLLLKRAPRLFSP